MPRVEAALALALEVLAQRPTALITDIDGTISPIVSRPEDAVVSGVAREALACLARCLDLVAVVTAREESIARAMVGLDGVTYFGNYALDAKARASLDTAGITAAKASVVALLPALTDVMLEEKGISFALHYRKTADPEAMRKRLLALLEPIALSTGVKLLEGKRVVELVPAGLPDKSTAVGSLLAAHGVRGAIYLGDDASDVSVFSELARLRQRDGLRTLALAVTDDETWRTVEESADLSLAGVGEVEDFLQRLGETLSAEGGA